MSLKQQHSSVSLSMGRLLWLGPLTVFVSIAVVLFIRVIGVTVLHPAPTFMPLRVLPAILDTAVLVIWAVIVFAAMTRFTSDPIRTFKSIALGVLLLSFVPDIALAKWHLWGATWTYGVVLMLMHVGAWGACVTVLTRLSQTNISPVHPCEQPKNGRV
jgi:uncharacterized protein DUF6069